MTRSVAGIALSLLAACLVLTSGAHAQAPLDSALAAYIAGVQAIDSHAHPMRPIPPGGALDTDYDALPLGGIPPFPLPWRLRPENPDWREAQRALYGVSLSDTGAAYRDALHAAVSRIAQQQGEHFPDWVLDRIGTQVMLANRVALGPGLEPPRFRWVAFADALMLPLDTHAEAARTPDMRVLYPLEARLLRRYLHDLGVATLPRTLDAYVAAVVVPTLRRQHEGGTVAVKFEAAYLRPLDFDDPQPALARRVYARYVSGGTPTHAEYKALEDHLFRVIAREAGRLGMAVQIHTTEGFGGYYVTHGSAPHLLEPAFNDSTLRGTNFIVVHGGWPLVGETEALLSKPNVYADISAIALFISPAELARVLRQWLGEWPEKVLFGTDAYDGGPEQGWAEAAWVGTTSARRALGIALTGMLRDGEIDRPRAERLARMVLRENAIAAYHLSLES
ncbi:MAG TPA: amidohydrolase family protein [Gemmatimonadaceae bacterium]|nr:amidohydrolase family protein [Gemmatimonadaceae bacterium]